MSGLPASGKNAWIETHAGDAEIVSLDDLRAEFEIDPGQSQGAVVAAARKRARAALRAGRTLIWNATNLGRDLRAAIDRPRSPTTAPR